MRVIRLAILSFFFMVMAAGAPLAQDGAQIGVSGKWEILRATSDGKNICFITSTPTKLEGKYDRNNRGETRVFVAHFAESRSQVSSVAGYTFKQGSDVVFAIDGKKFNFFNVKSRAWSLNAEQDAALVTAMKRGNTLKITGTSSRGNQTVDTYSLAGFTKAMQELDKACP